MFAIQIDVLFNSVLRKNGQSRILLDAAAVTGISTNVSKNCAVYDDNYSLSAGRAREARKALLNTVQRDKSISRRISVVGYGPDHLKNPRRPSADENRRVEIRLVARDAL